ncbi:MULTISPECIES: acyl-CoA thioesterase [Tenacibaculum]|uniref:Acyl-CoA thioesterase n=1 Tax=Tenacibaculum discolor TaxID=361581 RepID=A0A2G1BX01_9FLAO|nr:MULTISPECIES: acyl-CoA thioesterase [Tenacibaculum]MDP2540448.1 acyl-CoA thioesterase [Tenacibaculum discolor]NVK08898.1 acyl-CoA thioesterase [Tenacibaculum sp.]PHN98409.1 acyl-CoA thioesterase [Tenacibaculum discolor]PHO01646.1 acyl-CoA thioesterase [Rhodobacteraceae bacterium 4F10]
MNNNIYRNIEDTRITISELMLPSHANFSGKIHGGYILKLMDQIAFACASKHSGTYCVTASVDTVNFINPIEVGELVTMKASINYVGKTSMVVGIRVEAQNIQTGNTKHCNSSYFTMVAKKDNGDNAKVPGIIINDDNEMRRFLEAIHRIKMKKNRQEKFDNDNFTAQNYIEELKNYNVKIEL